MTLPPSTQPTSSEQVDAVAAGHGLRRRPGEADGTLWGRILDRRAGEPFLFRPPRPDSGRSDPQDLRRRGRSGNQRRANRSISLPRVSMQHDDGEDE